MSKRPDDTIYDVLAVGGFVLGKSHRMPPWGETLSSSDLRSLVKMSGHYASVSSQAGREMTSEALCAASRAFRSCVVSDA